jgi:hypothetical protein
MIVTQCSEVMENRELSISDPANFALANTIVLPCSICGDKGLEVFAKDAEFSKFTCQECW